MIDESSKQDEMPDEGAQENEAQKKDPSEDQTIDQTNVEEASSHREAFGQGDQDDPGGAADEEFFSDSQEDEALDPGDIVLAPEVLPEKIYVMPLMQRPFFPGMMVPMIFSGEPMLEAVKAAYETKDRVLGAVLVKEANQENIFESELYDRGTILKIHRVNPVSDDSIQVMAQGFKRFKRKRTIRTNPHIQWEVEYFDESEEKPDEELRAYTMAIINSVKELLKLNPLFQEQLKMLMSHINFERPGFVMDMIASMTTAESDKLQEILETLDLIERANKLLVLLKQEIEVSRIQERIKSTIEEKISKQQKEFFLQEQLKIIKKELGLEKDDKTQEIEKFEKRIKKLNLSEEARRVAEEEMGKFRLLEPASPEYHVTRTYLDWLTELPWGVFTEDSLDIKKAREVLESQHYGLDDVKDRILEFISAAIKRGSFTGSILCLVGPPGVGKTSVGRSIAEALNRKFYRFSLGGMRDEAEIKGHRRTYIGAMPGKFLQSLRRVESSNPVIMLDEIDKIGASFHGDPASALLEVLDPEQNREFLDHYMDIRYDLSHILFVTTANQLDTIPSPLLDRMEIIKLSGYILEEKREIAHRYLIPDQLKDHGFEKDELRFEDGALDFLIDRYAREAGVRNLEKRISKIIRKITLKQAEHQNAPSVIEKEHVEEFLGKPVFPEEELYQKEIPGVVLGLAWTSMGGATLYIEARAILSKNGGFRQTGQLGKVMEESSIIAHSFIRGLILSINPENRFFDENHIHLHVPAGATPKDGPSAGITMALALFSLAAHVPVRKGIAMTGELTLTGKVLPIGGVKEKVIAARRVGVFEIILPKENEKDYDDLPDHIKEGVTVHYTDYFEDVLDVVFPDQWKKFSFSGKRLPAKEETNGNLTHNSENKKPGLSSEDRERWIS